MSLDVYLTDDLGNKLFYANITHNLNKMATAAGLYPYLWKPNDLGINKASELIQPLESGLNNLKKGDYVFKKYEPHNGSGKYEHFVPWVEEYLNACRQHPDATVNVAR